MRRKKLNLTWIPNVLVHNVKTIPFLGVAFILGFEIRAYITPPLPNTIQSPTLTCKTCFTPNQACLPMIIEALDHAQIFIHLQAYSFTSKLIADALIRAKKRGVNIVIIVDKSQRKEKHTQIYRLKREGIPIYVDVKPAIAHNKIIIIDGGMVLSGSYNFSNSAEHRNAENVLLLTSPELAKIYEQNFAQRLAVSEVFTTDT